MGERPRAALGVSAGLHLAAIVGLGFVVGPGVEVRDTPATLTVDVLEFALSSAEDRGRASQRPPSSQPRAEPALDPEPNPVPRRDEARRPAVPPPIANPSSAASPVQIPPVSLEPAERPLTDADRGFDSREPGSTGGETVGPIDLRARYGGQLVRKVRRRLHSAPPPTTSADRGRRIRLVIDVLPSGRPVHRAEPAQVIDRGGTSPGLRRALLEALHRSAGDFPPFPAGLELDHFVLELVFVVREDGSLAPA